MTRLKAVGVATAITVAAIPLAVVLAGGPTNTVGDEVARQSAAWTGKHDARKKWREVPGLNLGTTNFVVTPGVLSVTVSAQMSKGAAKFRIVPTDSGQADPPASIFQQRHSEHAHDTGSPTLSVTMIGGEVRPHAPLGGADRSPRGGP
ncbi:MAG: hypothetical protein GEU78_17595 [Actinobacteria bacterium]|nr:hypothetical protein [Actinomycetota bacterium]